jgi:hypothetical protein
MWWRRIVWCGGKNNTASTLLERDIDYWCGKEKKNVTGVLVGIGAVYGKLERRQKLNISFGESVATVSLLELDSRQHYVQCPSICQLCEDEVEDD